jgi:mediator of RNA polymerase II transcription subunit 14
MSQSLVMEDIGWLDVARICGQGQDAEFGDRLLGKRKREHVFLGSDRISTKYARNVTMKYIASLNSDYSRFKLETQVLRELYAYCWCVRFYTSK